MIFNSNKDQLLDSIKQKISNIDLQCAFISHQISLYSDQRVNKLTQKTSSYEKEVNELEKQKSHKLNVLAKLKKDLVYLKGQEEDIQKQIKGKRQEKRAVQHSIAFLEQKHKEEAPHIQTFLSEKAKSKENAGKVRYARQKLTKLNDKLKKQWDEVQYQYRLNILIKQKLKQISKENNLSNEGKAQSGTAMNSIIEGSQQTPEIHLFKQAKNTDFSDYNESIITSFRD